MKRQFLLLILLLAVAGGIVWHVGHGANAPLNELIKPAANSEEAFANWLREDPARGAGFDEFSAFLDKHDVSGVVPNWQLLRTDSKTRSDCERPAFLLPPRDKWANIVPALELVRDHVSPRLGELEVMSAYRPPELNACIKGAGRSRHLSFHALDLVAPDWSDKRALFAELCTMHKELGSRSHMGLGAYFDPTKPVGNGQFHIDATGFRTWGHSYRKESSGCRLFR